VEQEINFLKKFGVRAIPYYEKEYPGKLKNCYDAPILLYYKGNAGLNHSRVVSIIGTRNNTEYGKEMVRSLVEDLVPFSVMVVSGLAYGVDALAHKQALKCGLQTIGVMAHGLDRIYPPAHRGLAKEMLEQGGLLTDFMTGEDPDKQNFPKRNRIVAGLADATVVIETGIKGGSMITAELANGYNRDVFAFPGRVKDPKSEGCNFLIRNNKAALITSAMDIVNFMNWEEKRVQPKLQPSLFHEFSEEEKRIMEILSRKEIVHIDQIYSASGLRNSEVASIILNLELQNLIQSLPGKLYKIR
jgi:DNA processing protein